MDTVNRVYKFILENDLIRSEEGILVGVSGGPDSMVLLDILYRLKEVLNIRIAVGHINHLLRGSESDQDEKYVEEFCKDRDIPCFSTKINILEISKLEKISLEEAGRKARYDFFERVAKEGGYSKIATAHNANDQVETVIMRMMRGTGLEGLTGIPVIRGGKFIRPILFLERAEIEEYSLDENLKPRVDKSNLERDYSRNKIRLDIIPYMKENFNENLISTVNRMITTLNEDGKIINKVVEECGERYLILDKDKVIIKGELIKEDKSLVNRVIRKGIEKLLGSSYNLEFKHICLICDLFNMDTNKKINLPEGLSGENIYGDIIIRKNKEDNVITKSEEVIINKGSELSEVTFNSYSILFEVIKNHEKSKINDNNLIKYFNYDKINDNIIIRYRKNGDRITPLGMKGSRKLKDIFIDNKIPVEKRNSLPVIQFDDEIAWVVGVKLSEVYKITKETKMLLKITVKERN